MIVWILFVGMVRFMFLRICLFFFLSFMCRFLIFSMFCFYFIVIDVFEVDIISMLLMIL